MNLGQAASVAFHTLGCKVNQYDSQAMEEKFVENGYKIVEFNDVADIYIINTCTVTNLGDRKSRQMIRRANRLNPKALVVAVGCYAQTSPKEVMELPGVSLVLGTKDRDKIVEFVQMAGDTDRPINGVGDIMTVKQFEETPISSFDEKTRAILKVQEGCDRFCSYCIIPYARGPIRSREPNMVLDEVKRLVDLGFVEFVLTGIHLASYGRDLRDIDLLTLIEKIAHLKGVKRIRLGSLEPTLLTEDFVKRIREIPVVCEHYHLSLQSGCDETLQRMNRRYSTKEFKEIVDRLRDNIPGVAITTDIMVGFPGESQDEFNKTLDFVEDIAFSKIHVFKYSQRKGTPAARFKDQILDSIKEVRSQKLMALGESLERKYLESFMDKREEVLFETLSKDNKGWYEGYTRHYIRVATEKHDGLLGSAQLVNLQGIQGNVMLGQLAKD